jgi:hypothetical protein
MAVIRDVALVFVGIAVVVVKVGADLPHFPAALVLGMC